MAVEYRVISIGTLSRNLLWSEVAPVRTAHATVTLICDGKRKILVDPSLPEQVLAARFNERTGTGLSEITDVFCTTLRPAHRRGIEALSHAGWWTGESELETYRGHLEGLRGSADRLSSEDTATIETDLGLLERFAPAPEKFTHQVHLYPLQGPSPGSMGLLLTPATTTVVVAGDAAVTAEHIRAGQIWHGCADHEASMASLRDLLELADIIIPGHDNLMIAPGRWL